MRCLISGCHFFFLYCLGRGITQRRYMLLTLALALLEDELGHITWFSYPFTFVTSHCLLLISVLHFLYFLSKFYSAQECYISWYVMALIWNRVLESSITSGLSHTVEQSVLLLTRMYTHWRQEWNKNENIEREHRTRPRKQNSNTMPDILPSRRFRPCLQMTPLRPFFLENEIYWQWIFYTPIWMF